MATTSSTRRGRRGNTRERPTRFPIVPPIRLPATTIPATPPPMARLARRSACSPLPALLDTPPPAVCSRMAPMAARSGRSRRRFTWPVRLSPRRSTPRAPWWPRRSTPRAPWWPRCDRAVLYCVPRPGAVQRAHHPLRDGRAAPQLPLRLADACRGRLVRNRRREPGVPSITSVEACLGGRRPMAGARPAFALTRLRASLRGASGVERKISSHVVSAAWHGAGATQHRTQEPFD